MNAENFVQKLTEVIVEENNVIYRELFCKTNIDGISDEYWLKAKTLYLKLNAEEQEVLFEIMRQISADTLSNVFGVLDGSSYLDEGQNEFKLLIDEEKEPINGELQEIFLEMEENRNSVNVQT